MADAATASVDLILTRRAWAEVARDNNRDNNNKGGDPPVPNDDAASGGKDDDNASSRMRASTSAIVKAISFVNIGHHRLQP
jgi:hypothetical protein